ncbi:MAG: hypothetical protein Kow009_01430 [Spirochaetales bacterium]
MLELKLDTPFKNAPVFYKPETESTMIDARNLASQGFPTGTLVVTSYQIAGRGRFPDRKWESPPDESLLCTLILRTGDVPAPPGPLHLKAALAIATLLEEEFNLSPRIKWPNDVLLKDRKVAGVLAEARDQAILVGMGINCLQKSFPRELRKTATSIRKVSGRKFEVQELISPLLNHLHRWILGTPGNTSGMSSSGGIPAGEEHPLETVQATARSIRWKGELESRLHQRNESVWFQPGIPGQDEPIAGTILGVTEEGILLLRPEGSSQILEFAAGEILFPAKS